jgi:peptide/nickel transport system substrate-binding protein
MTERFNIGSGRNTPQGCRRLNRRVAQGALCALMSLGIAACGGSGTAGPVSKSAVSIRLVFGDFDTLNPATTETYSGPEMDEFLYDRLVSQTASGKIVPYLATSWKVTATAATFHIRHGATCTDGTAITPTVIKNSLDYLAAPATGAFATPLTFGASTPAITADNTAGTVEISLAKPYPELLDALSNPAASIICPAGLRDLTALKHEAFGSGPYVLSQSLRGTEYTLTKRRGYDWGPLGTDYAAMPHTITTYVYANETTATNAALSGQIDLLSVIGRDVGRLRPSSAFVAKPHYLSGADALAFNESSGLPGADPKVREALALAVNSTAYNHAATFGLAPLSTTLLTPGMSCYDPADGSAAIGYNPSEAERILHADGWVRGAGGILRKNGKPLTIRIVADPNTNEGGEYLQNAFQKLGVDARLQEVNDVTYVTITETTGQWDVNDYGFGGPFNVPAFIAVQASGPAPPKGINIGFVDNPAFNDLAHQAESAPADTTCALWHRAERALLARADFKPLYELPINWFGRVGVDFAPSWGVAIDPFSLRG